MAKIAGKRATGQRVEGPDADLVELSGGAWALVFHDAWADDIEGSLDTVQGFLEMPMVEGIVELTAIDGAAYVYPVGHAVPVASLLAAGARSLRAGLELFSRAANILLEAAEAGESQGVYCHGNINPWRVLITAEGGIRIVGHGLPPADVLRAIEQEDEIVSVREVLP